MHQESEVGRYSAGSKVDVLGPAVPIIEVINGLCANIHTYVNICIYTHGLNTYYIYIYLLQPGIQIRA